MIDAAIWGRGTAAGVKTRLRPVSSSGYAVAEEQAAAPECRVGKGGLTGGGHHRDLGRLPEAD